MRRQTTSWSLQLKTALRHCKRWHKAIRKPKPRSGADRKDFAMNGNNFSSLPPKRITALAFSAFALLALASISGCGGGGGGASTPTAPAPAPVAPTPPAQPPVAPAPPPQPTGSVAPTNCEIPGNAGSCNGRATILNLANASNVTLVVGEGATATTIPVSGNGEVMVPLSGEQVKSLTLKAGDGTVLDSKTVTSNCSPISAWDTALGEGRCTVKLCYDEAVVSVAGSDATPYSITLTGRERVKNSTDIPDSWEASGYLRRYFNCGVGTVDNFGRLPFVCNEQNGDFNSPTAYNWRYFYLNPIAGTFHRYKEGSLPATGPAPAGFVFVDEYNPSLPTGWGNATSSTKNGGRFYNYGGGDAGSMFDLWFLKDGRPESERQLVFAGTTGAQGTGSFSVLRTVKNSCAATQ